MVFDTYHAKKYLVLISNHILPNVLILEEMRDLQFIIDHQEKLQGKYDALVEFGSTPGGVCAFKKDLFAIPIVITINFSTKNLSFLETCDWLSLPENRVVVDFPYQEGQNTETS